VLNIWVWMTCWYLTTIIKMTTGSNHIFIVHTCFSWQQITSVVTDLMVRNCSIFFWYVLHVLQNVCILIFQWWKCEIVCWRIPVLCFVKQVNIINFFELTTQYCDHMSLQLFGLTFLYTSVFFSSAIMLTPILLVITFTSDKFFGV